jgi:hypothetical protein
MNDVSSPKRSEPEKVGLHAWLPYYAGFSEAFVDDMVYNLGLSADQLILDPMSGSGTTNVVAQDRGHLSIAVELNPAMAIISRAKDPTFVGREDLMDIARELAGPSGAGLRFSFPDHATAWFSEVVLRDLTDLSRKIESLTQPPYIPLDDRLGTLLNGHRQDGGRAKDLLFAALLITARRVSRSEVTKNPTWFRPDPQANGMSVDVKGAFVETVKRMVNDLSATFGQSPDRDRRFLCLHGNAKSLPLPDNSIDAIITSPPYLTRIDYAVGTTPELVVLGHHSRTAFRDVRTQLMGSPCVTGGSYETVSSWGETCLDILNRVRGHPSKASAGYYLKTHVQYFRDAEAIVREALRVLRPQAHAAFVVQGSWYKNIHIPLGQIYQEMALNSGARTAEIVRRETVSRHMGLVNSRARMYKKGELQEHVVLFSK